MVSSQYHNIQKVRKMFQVTKRPSASEKVPKVAKRKKEVVFLVVQTTAGGGGVVSHHNFFPQTSTTFWFCFY